MLLGLGLISGRASNLNNDCYLIANVILID